MEALDPARQSRRRRCCAGLLGLGVLLAGLVGCGLWARNALYREDIAAELRELHDAGLDTSVAALYGGERNESLAPYLELGRDYQARDAELPDAVAGLSGSDWELLAAGIEDPEGPLGSIAYMVISGDRRSPATIQGGIAQLTSAHAPLDARFDGLADPEETKLLPVVWGEGEHGVGFDALYSVHHLISSTKTRAGLRALRGDHEGAWRLLLRLAALTRRCGGQPSALCAATYLSLASGLIDVLLEHLCLGPPPSAEVSEALSAALEGLAAASDPVTGFRGEIRIFLHGSRSDEGWLKFCLEAESNGPRSLLSALAPEEPGPVTLAWARVWKAPGWRRDAVLHLGSLLRAAMPLTPETGAKLVRRLEDLDDPFLKACAGSWPAIVGQHFNLQALVRITQIGLALARGEPPPVLADPWSPSGDPIRWRRDGDAHFLWSVGCDRRNDQGAYDAESTEEWERILSHPKPAATLGVGDVTVRLRLPHTAAARADDAPPK